MGPSGVGHKGMVGKRILVQTEQNIMYKVVKTIIALHKKIMKRHNKDSPFLLSTFDLYRVSGVNGVQKFCCCINLCTQVFLFLVPSNIEYTLGEQKG